MSQHDIAADLRYPDGPEEPQFCIEPHFVNRHYHACDLEIDHVGPHRCNGCGQSWEQAIANQQRSPLPGPVDPPRPPGWDKGVA